MPRTIGAGLQTHLQTAATTTTRCLKIKRTDGEIFAFTKLDEDITIDISDGDGSVTYTAGNSTRLSSVDHVAGLQPDNFSISGILSDDAIAMADLRNGLFNSATYTLFEMNYETPANGTVILQTGWLGEVQITDNGFSVEMRPLTDAYNQRIGELISPLCRADLGDARCKVRLDPNAWVTITAYTAREDRDAGTGSVVKPTVENGFHFKCTTAGTSGVTEPTWTAVLGAPTTDGTVEWEAIKALSLTGTVSVVVDRANFTATGITMEADWWNYGVLEWLTGDNAGLKSEVKDDSGAGVLRLFLPIANTIVVGDTFLVKAGCDKRQATCISKFDNIYNRRAEDFVPGTDVALTYPDAT
jgi:hypothetical protein